MVDPRNVLVRVHQTMLSSTARASPRLGNAVEPLWLWNLSHNITLKITYIVAEFGLVWL